MIDHCAYECDKEIEDYRTGSFKYVSFAALFCWTIPSSLIKKTSNGQEEPGFLCGIYACIMNYICRPLGNNPTFSSLFQSNCMIFIATAINITVSS